MHLLYPLKQLGAARFDAATILNKLTSSRRRV